MVNIFLYSSFICKIVLLQIAFITIFILKVLILYKNIILFMHTDGKYDK